MTLPEGHVKKYLDGLATPAEARKIVQWFKTEEGQHYLEKNLAEDFESLKNRKWIFGQEPDSAKILTNIYQSVKTERSATAERKNKVGVYRVAAGLIFILCFVSAYLYFNLTSEVVYVTRFGERKEIVLPDHSKVILNGNSSLKTSSVWKKNDKREVWLIGEGFFDVVHTQNHNRFIVHTSTDFNIQVLGTIFNVANRQNRTTVALEEGKVQLNINEQGKTSHVTMKPGEVVEFDRTSSFLIRKESKKVEAIASWKGDVMELEQTSVKEIASLLENTYGLRMIIDDPTILEQKITGSIPNGNIDLFLNGLAVILEVNVGREDGVVYLTKKAN